MQGASETAALSLLFRGVEDTSNSAGNVVWLDPDKRRMCVAAAVAELDRRALVRPPRLHRDWARPCLICIRR